MDILSSREDIKDFIVGIEKNFPVNSWKVNGIHVWPILRISLFFDILLGNSNVSSHEKNSKGKANSNLLRRGLRKIRRVALLWKNYLIAQLWLIKLPKRKIVFVGAGTYRVLHKGAAYNRFFDSLIELEDIVNYMYLEYLPGKETMFNSELVYPFERYLNLYVNFRYLKESAKSINIEIEGYETFLNYLTSHSLTAKICNKYDIELQKERFEKYAIRINFFYRLFDRVKPSCVYIICYYSDIVMALTTAANRLKIETIEMQHGPMTRDHLAYGSWSTMPKSGYDALPRKYWLWDKNSAKSISAWSDQHPIFNYMVKYNPWIEYWEFTTKGNSYKEESCKKILYSLQPNIALDDLFPKVLVDFINTYQNYFWIIRVHPRQRDELFEISQFAASKILKNNHIIDDSKLNPLPKVLKEIDLHITHSSGCTIEAAYFNVRSVLMSLVGKEYYQDYITDGMAVYIDHRDSRFSKLLINYLEEL